MKLTTAAVQRAKDLAARSACDAYVHALKTELHRQVGSSAEESERLAPEGTEIDGIHVHEAVVVDPMGGAVVFRLATEIDSNPARVAERIKSARAVGTG